MKNKPNEIVVDFITHGLYSGSQAHYDSETNKYTLYTNDGLERNLRATSYFRVVNELV